MKAAVLATALILILACGGDDKPGPTNPYDAEGNYRGTTPSPTQRITPSPTPQPTPAPTPSPTPVPLVGTSRDNPLPIGQSQKYGGTWEITVLNVTPDATILVMAENSYNDPPAPGNQFFVATLAAKYLGPNSAAFNEYDLGAVGPGAVTYSGFDNDCGVTPLAMSSYQEAYTNGIILGNVCWEIASSDAPGLVMFYDPYSLGDELRFYWDLSP